MSNQAHDPYADAAADHTPARALAALPWGAVSQAAFCDEEPSYRSQTEVDYSRLPWVPGEGRAPCSVMFVGEAPARHEVRERRPFVGMSGEVLWQLALRYAGLTRQDVYVTNLVKHEVEEDPTPEEIAYWAPVLEKELRRVQPEYVVTLGRFSTRFFLGPEVTMDWAAGLAHGPFSAGGPWGRCRNMTVIPVHHPAAGLHQTSMLTLTRRDLEAVGEIVRGRGPRLPADEYPRPVYREGLPTAMGAVLAVDTEGSAEAPVCLQFTDEAGRANLIRAGDELLLGMFIQLLLTAKPLVVMHHSVHDLAVLRAMGIDLVAWSIPIADTMVMAYNAQDLPRGLKPLARRLCGMEMQDYQDVVIRPYLQALEQHALDELALTTGCRLLSKHKVPKPLKHPEFAYTEQGKLLKRALVLKEEDDRLERLCAAYEVPPPALDPDDPAHFRYACRDPDAALRVYPKLKAILRERELVTVTQLDHGVLPMIDRMQQVGMPIDQSRVEVLRADLLQEVSERQELIETLTGVPGFNPRSGDQVADWCNEQWRKHGICGLERQTRSKAREATDEAELKKIRDDHPAIPLILEWRGLEKLRTDYADKLARYGDLYHPDFRTASVFSGRAAEWVLTMPTRTEWGRRVRGCFVAPEGWLFGSADLNQIELRLLAHESGDVELCRVFWEGIDPHTSTASHIFGVPYDQVDKLTQRYPAKTTNYLMVYGGDEYTLHDDLISNGITTFDLLGCRALIANWFELYNGVRDFMRSKADEARRQGFVRDAGGRLRFLPAIHLEGAPGLGHWENRQLEKLAKEAQRQAGNHPIQGGATRVLKRAQVRFWRVSMPRLLKQDIEVRPLLPFHDELLVLFPEQHEESVKQELLWAMTADSDLYSVPILSEWTSGKDWGAVKG